MKERPILMSAPMVRAILDGRKTMTRRIVKEPYQSYPCVAKHLLSNEFDFHYDQGIGQFTKCPYGKSGDILWVREAFYAFGHWTVITNNGTGKTEWHFNDLTLSEGKIYMYENNPPDVILKGRFGIGYFKRPSIFMPKVASRISLEVTGVRVERLQDISEEDAISEGLQSKECTDGHQSFGIWYSSECGIWHPNPVDAYSNLWESINGKGSWGKNPWVWCIEFKRVQP